MACAAVRIDARKPFEALLDAVARDGADLARAMRVAEVAGPRGREGELRSLAWLALDQESPKCFELLVERGGAIGMRARPGRPGVAAQDRSRFNIFGAMGARSEPVQALAPKVALLFAASSWMAAGRAPRRWR